MRKKNCLTFLLYISMPHVRSMTFAWNKVKGKLLLVLLLLLLGENYMQSTNSSKNRSWHLVNIRHLNSIHKRKGIYPRFIIEIPLIFSEFFLYKNIHRMSLTKAEEKDNFRMSGQFVLLSWHFICKIISIVFSPDSCCDGTCLRPQKHVSNISRLSSTCREACGLVLVLTIV